MKLLIKQIIATAIIVATAYALMCELINILTRTIDNPTTHIALSLFVVLWITLLALYILARTLSHLRPGTPSYNREVIYTEDQLAHRDRNYLGDTDENQESIKRKYAIRD